MKRTNKLLALALALAMLLSLSITAFAAETGNTITVEKAQKGETYSIYKMLDLSVNADKTAFTYTVNEDWTNFFSNSGAGAAYVDIDDSGYVTWKADKNGTADMIAFGKAAAEYAAGSSVATAQPDQTPVEDKNITFTNLDPGYYLITSTNGTKAIVDTTPTNPNPSIAEKNDDPTISKTVEEDSNGVYKSANDAEIGQTVNFKTVVSAKSGAKNYVVHDKMSDGLAFDGATSVTVTADGVVLVQKGDGEAANPYSADNPNGYRYEVVTGEDNCDFEIVFVQAYLDTITENINITINYSATLTKDAVVGGNGNTNETKLSWGQGSETIWSVTKTYTWEMDVLKHETGNEEKVLKDAQFVLLNGDKDKVAKFDGAGKIIAWADVPTAPEGGEITWPEGTIQTTNEEGKIFIKGLDSTDTYYLREVKAPAGYNLLNADQAVVIQLVLQNLDGIQTMTQVTLTQKVANASGTELPSTGGMGTTIFYVVGSILLVGAAVLLITKKRMSAAQ